MKAYNTLLVSLLGLFATPNLLLSFDQTDPMDVIHSADIRAMKAEGSISTLEDELNQSHFFQKDQKKHIIDRLSHAQMDATGAYLDQAQGFLYIIISKNYPYLHSGRISIIVKHLKNAHQNINKALSGLKKIHPNQYKEAIKDLKECSVCIETALTDIPADDPSVEEPDMHDPFYNLLAHPTYEEHPLANTKNPQIPFEMAVFLNGEIKNAQAYLEKAFLELKTANLNRKVQKPAY